MKSLRATCRLSLVVFIGFAAGSAAAEEREGGRALALGDSVVFGFITRAGHQYVNANNFIASPDYYADLLHLRVTNAGCPGEATSGFLSSTGADNNCRPFKAEFPLHVAYTSTQLAFATTFLTQHPDTRLVTIGIGANDVFLLEKACATSPNPSQCIQAGLPAVLAEVASNVATILADLRATGFAGVLIIVNYYSTDYSDPVGTQATVALNQAITAYATLFHAVVADVFTAFETVAGSSGKTCNAGLLNVDPQDPTLMGCDVHPSQSGQQLIAETIARTYRAAR